jgi:hypothetical protein
MGGFTRRTQAFIGRRVSGRWHQVAAWWDEKVADRFRRPPPDQEEPRDPLEPLAAQVAMAEFARDLERLRSKREWLQSRRVRTDSELLPLFHFALEPSLDSGTYLAMHRLVLGRLGLTERFAAGQLHVPVAS